MKVQHKRKLVAFSIILLALVAMAGLASMKIQPPKKSIVTKAMFVDTLDLKAANVTFEIKSQGTVNPKTETLLSAEVSGRIISISDNFIAGGVFNKGDVLLEIDPTDYKFAVAQADAFLKQREIEYNGAKSLRSKGYRAESELAAAKASLAAAKASLIKAQKNLERTKIRLPYDGLVRSKDADIGQFVNLGTKLGTTFSTDVAEIRLALTDHDLAFVDLPETRKRSEQSAKQPTVILSAIRKGVYQEWKAKIVRSEGIVDSKSRVTYAVVQLDDPYRLATSLSSEQNTTPLPIGTFVRATIMGKTFNNVIKVPRTALRGKNQLLFVDAESRLQIKEVEIIRADTQFAYILWHSAMDTRISITAIESPINGMKVRTSADEKAQTMLAGNSSNQSNESQVENKAK